MWGAACEGAGGAGGAIGGGGAGGGSGDAAAGENDEGASGDWAVNIKGYVWPNTVNPDTSNVKLNVAFGGIALDFAGPILS